MKGILRMVWALIFITIIVALFVFHTWTKHQITITGKKITQEVELFKFLNFKNKELLSELAKLKKMERIELIAKEVLNMHIPEKKEIIKETQKKMEIKDQRSVVSGENAYFVREQQ